MPQARSTAYRGGAQDHGDVFQNRSRHAQDPSALVVAAQSAKRRATVSIAGEIPGTRVPVRPSSRMLQKMGDQILECFGSGPAGIECDSSGEFEHYYGAEEEADDDLFSKSLGTELSRTPSKREKLCRQVIIDDLDPFEHIDGQFVWDGVHRASA